MKQDKKEKRNNILYSVLGLVLGIAMCGIGIYGMILNRIEDQEYKNTTDKSLRKESKVVQTKKQYGDFSLTALSFASISIFSG